MIFPGICMFRQQRRKQLKHDSELVRPPMHQPYSNWTKWVGLTVVFMSSFGVGLMGSRKMFLKWKRK